MFETLTAFTESLPTWLQWLGVALIGAIPFVESYLGSAIGVFVGVPPAAAIAAAVAGNIVSTLAVIFGVHSIRRRVVAGREPERPSPRRERIRRLFDRYGVAGVSLIGPTVLAGQITSGMMISFGASRRLVVIWQIVAIIAWWLLFGVLATIGVDLVSGR